MLAIVVWFFVDARKWFKGPKINIEHHMLHQDLRAHPGVDISKSSNEPTGDKLDGASSTDKVATV